MTNNGIYNCLSENEQKTAVVEQFNRRLKTCTWTYLSDKGKNQWVNALFAILNLYNKSYYCRIYIALNQSDK